MSEFVVDLLLQFVDDLDGQAVWVVVRVHHRSRSGWRCPASVGLVGGVSGRECGLAAAYSSVVITGGCAHAADQTQAECGAGFLWWVRPQIW